MDQQQLWTILWSALGTVITGLFSWLTSVIISWLNTKIKDQKLRTFLTKFTEIVTRCVKSLTQTTVQGLKKDGKFDSETAKKVKEECINLIKAQLAPDMIEFIQNNFGDVTEYISIQIESFILDCKNFH